MAIILIQHAAVHNDASPGSLTIAPSNARSLIVVMIINSSGNTVSSVVDNSPGGSSLYVQVPNARSVSTVNGEACDIWYTANSHQKATSITIALSASGTNDIFIFEVQNMNSSSPFQEIGVVNDGVATTKIVGASVTTSNALDFIASVVNVSGGVSNITAGNAFTLGDIANGNASAYLITKQKGTYNPSFDSSLSTFCSSTSSFREAPHSIDVRGISNNRKTRPDYYEG